MSYRYRGRIRRFARMLLWLGVGLLPGLALAIPEGPTYPSAAWTAREAQNYANVLKAPTEQVSDPTFVLRLTTQSTLNLGT